MTQYWLMKCEPDVYSIYDLEKDGVIYWEGVRNYQARNFMRDDMKIGDKVLFYHSNSKPPGVAGLATVHKESYPDYFAFNPESKYFDPKSDKENPRWWMVDVKFEKILPKYVPLNDMKADERCAEMQVVQKGSRLSIHPIKEAEYKTICEMGGL